MELFNAENIKLKQIAKVLAFVFVFAFTRSWGQVLVTTTSYFQDFGTTDITTWTNNTTINGWYSSIGISGHENVQTSPVPTNNGGFYSYECNGDNNQKLGTRPSNGTGAVGTFLRFGVRLANNTGLTIQSIRVSFDAYQFSLAANGSVANILGFDYLVSGTAITNVTGAGYTSVASLAFAAPQSTTNSTSTGVQLAGYPCNQTQFKSACIPVTIPNNSEIMLRWSDENNSNNDPHFGIDNLRVDFGIGTNDCLTILPIELIDFYATKKDNSNHIIWKVADEINVESYMIERSEDGINFSLLENITLSQGITDNTSIKTYLVVDENPFEEFTYYRLGTKSKDGSNKYYKIITVDENSNDWKTNYYQKNGELTIEFKNLVPKNSTISLFDLSGKLLAEENIKDSQTKIHVQNLAEGLYFVKIQSPYKTDNFKIIIQK